MDLGAFSISLAVRDIAASAAFYEKLGFRRVGGNADDNWLILRNGACVIGLFQGMFDGNLLTFNPGWDQDSKDTENFTDIREIQAALQAQGIDPDPPVDPATAGPASLWIEDPDGNRILIDQHR